MIEDYNLEVFKFPFASGKGIDYPCPLLKRFLKKKARIHDIVYKTKVNSRTATKKTGAPNKRNVVIGYIQGKGKVPSGNP